MAKIRIVSSMALDAICFLQQLNYAASNNLLPEQEEFIKKIGNITGDKLKTGAVSMSTLCGVITAYAENCDFENYTLGDLADMFKNPENMRDVVKSREINEFQASYFYQMIDEFVNGWAEKYFDYINILK